MKTAYCLETFDSMDFDKFIDTIDTSGCQPPQTNADHLLSIKRKQESKAAAAAEMERKAAAAAELDRLARIEAANAAQDPYRAMMAKRNAKA